MAEEKKPSEMTDVELAELISSARTFERLSRLGLYIALVAVAIPLIIAPLTATVLLTSAVMSAIGGVNFLFAQDHKETRENLMAEKTRREMLENMVATGDLPAEKALSYV